MAYGLQKHHGTRFHINPVNRVIKFEDESDQGIFDKEGIQEIDRLEWNSKNPHLNEGTNRNSTFSIEVMNHNQQHKDEDPYTRRKLQKTSMRTPHR